MGLVYLITISATRQQYVGATSAQLKFRRMNHLTNLRAGQGPRLLQAAYDLHGEASLDFDTLYEGPDYREMEIEILRRLNPALNHAYTTRSNHEVRKRNQVNGRIRRRYEVEGEMLTSQEIIARYGQRVMTRVYARDPHPTRPLYGRTK